MRKKDDGVLVYVVYVDYYIFLCVCVWVVEIDIRNMYRGVLSFERRLVWIEKRIDNVLYLILIFMKCKYCDYGNVDLEDYDDDMVLF